jgi:hypothetical protein
MHPQQSQFLETLRSVIPFPKGVSWEPSEEELYEAFCRLVLRERRARIRRGPYSGPVGSPQRRAADRFGRRISREKLKKFRAAGSLQRPRNLRREMLLARCTRSPILDGLVPDRKQRWRPMVKRLVRSETPSIRLKNFSFLANAEQTLRNFRAIAELELSEISAHLHFDDEYCLDAGAYLVLAEIWHAVRHSLSGGKMEKPVQKVLAATGVGDHNRMKLMGLGGGKEEDTADIWAFPLHRRRPARSSRSPTVHLEPQTREKTADALCEKIDEWLGVPGIEKELTQAGRGWIAQIIGELLCNAERHSQADSVDGDWSTTAFMARREIDGVASLKCHIAFLSVGRSMAESLDDAADDISKAIRDYVKRHRGCGLSRETLATVYALQDTVTRDPAASGEKSGGTGLQDVLDFVIILGGGGREGPRITVISGSSCLELRHPYVQGFRRGGPQAPRVIWFNPSNSSEYAPDRDFVKDLPDHFAGTLVSVAFTLDPAYLAGSTESDDEENRP